MMCVYNCIDGDISHEDFSQESLEFCANVEKHMQQSGAVNRFLASIVFVGLPGSGKTTLIARLLKLEGVDEMLKASGSTGVMDGIIAVDIAEDQHSIHAANVGDNCEWQKVEFRISCLQQMGARGFVLQSTHDSSLPENSSSPGSSHCGNIISHNKSSPERPYVADASHLDPFEKKPEKPAKHLGTPEPKHHQQSSIPEHKRKSAKHSAQSVIATLQAVLCKEGFSAVRPYLENKSTLYLSDTGI